MYSENTSCRGKLQVRLNEGMFVLLRQTREPVKGGNEMLEAKALAAGWQPRGPCPQEQVKK